MKAFIIYILLIFFTGHAFAQIENTSKPGAPQVRANFYQDILNFSSDKPGETRVDVFIQVPYTELQFVKNSQNFTAGYSITLSVFDEKKEKLVVEKIWNEKVESRQFDQTVSKNNFNLSLKNFFLPPGKYLMRTTVDDNESQKTFSIEYPYVVRDMAVHPSISDIMFISRLTTTTDSSGNDAKMTSSKILPNVSRNISVLRDGIPFFYEIYADSAQNVHVQYQLVDTHQKIVLSKDTVQQVDAGKNQVFYTIQNADLGLGTYQVKVLIMNDDDDVVSSVEKSFVSRWIGVPSVIKDLEKAISQMVYIASGDEIDKIEDAESQNEKIKLYMDFWKTKDPTPNSEENEIFDEYYRRVALANDSFSHYIEGWRTDRGMVFIILGAPNNIERHPFDYDAKPYEVWQYYELNKEFVFVDENGFGDYRLITPLYGDYYRFR